MRRRIARSGFAVALLAAGSLGTIVAREARPTAGPTPVADEAKASPFRPYRPKHRFTVAIERSDGTFWPANMKLGDVKDATFKNADGKISGKPWKPVDVKLTQHRKRLHIVFMPEDPTEGIAFKDDGQRRTAGTGTIVVSTTTPPTSTDPTNNVPVEPTDTSPCP